MTTICIRPGMVLAVALLLAGSLVLAGCDSFGETTAQEHLQAAQQYLDEGDSRSAEIELRNALQKDGSLVRARRALGELRLRSGDAAGAAKELQRAVEAGASEQALAPMLGEALLFSGEPQAALDLVERVEVGEDAAGARLTAVQGYALYATGQEAQGCNALSRAAAIDPDLAAADLGVAECAAAEGRFAQAAGRAQGLLEREPGYIRGWELLARLELARGRRDAAAEAYERMLETGGRDLAAHLGLARIRFASGDLEAADEHATRALRSRRDHPDAHFLKGLVHFRNERLDDAQASFQAALNSNPDHVGAQFFLGATHFAQEGFEQARHRFAQVVRQRPGLREARLLLQASQARLEGRTTAGQSFTIGSMAQASEGLVLPAEPEAEGGEGAMTPVAPADVSERFGDAAGAGGGSLDGALDAITEGDGALSRQLAEVAGLLRGGEREAALARITELRQQRPQEARLPALEGVVRFLEEDNAAAERGFQQALELDPQLPGAHHGLAMLALRRGDADAARAHFDEALEASPGNLATELALFQLARRTGDTEGARQWLEQAARNNPESPVAAGLYGLSLLERGESERALEVAERALQANPDNGGLLLLRGDALLALGDLEDAVDAYEAGAAGSPDSVRAQLKLAFAHAAREDVDATRAALEAALDIAPEQPAAIIPLARLESRTGNHERALELADRLTQLEDGGGVDGALARAEVLAASGEPADAMSVLEGARRNYPGSAAIVGTLSRFYWATGEREASVSLLEEWTAENPDDGTAWRLLGDQHYALQRLEAAEKAYERSIEANPDDWQALNNLASLRGERAPQEALPLAQRAMDLAPENAFVQDTLGWLLVQTGATEEGVELLARAREQLGQVPAVRYNYAAALARQGRAEEARAELEALLAEVEAFSERGEAEALLADLQRGSEDANEG